MATPSKFLGVGSSSNSRSVKPSLPDVTKGIYATDEYRMYSCKVEKCPYDVYHKWSHCPFWHTGDRDRRRDPKKYVYTYMLCSNFTNRICDYGDYCRNSHGNYERGLHPDLYKTELCALEPPCTRAICFYAHTQEELRKTSRTLSASSRISLADMGFEPAPCPKGYLDFPSSPVTLPKSPSTIEMSKNAPNNPFESSNEQNLPSQPSLSAANSPSPYNPLEGLTSKEQSLLPQPSLSESPSTILISDSTPDNPLEGSSSNEQSLPSQPSLSESPSTILISNNAPDNNPLEGSSSNEQSLLPQPSLSDSPSTIEISDNAPYELLEGSSLNEQSLPSQESLMEFLSTISISNYDPDNPLEGLSSKEQSLLPQPSLSESSSTILISDSTPDDPLEGSSSNEQSLPSQPSLSESPSGIAFSNNAPDYTLEGSWSWNPQSILPRPSLSADSLRSETSFSSDMEDDFPGKNYHAHHDPFSSTLTSTDESRKQTQSMLSPSRTYFSPRNVSHSLPQPLIGVTTESASPTNSQVSMPALQATQPQQIQSPSSSNPVFSSSAADNSLDDDYETWYGPKPDITWVSALLDEAEE